jgi:hypothetical protein
MSKLFIVAAVFILVVGCSESENNMEGCCSVPLSVVPFINPDEATTAHLDDDIGSYQIGIQVTNFSGSELYYPYTKNIKLSRSGTWMLSSLVCISCIKAKIYAYSPYSASESDLTGTGETSRLLIDIPAIQDMRDQVDYLYASQDKHLPVGGSDIINMNPDVTLRMNHALALVSFVIYKGSYSGAGVLTQIELKDDAALSNLTVNKTGINDLGMNLGDGAITGGEPSAVITVKSVGNVITETTDPGTDEEVLKTKINGYAYVIPATFADKTKVRFTFTIDGQLFTVSLSGAEALSWTKGNQYIYKIELSTTFLSIVDVTVTDWITNDGGEVLIN